jgi:predicted polyphosphate/ATP-dependent NAD kinase
LALDRGGRQTVWRHAGAGRAIVQSCNARRGGIIFGFGNRQLSLQVVQAVECDSITVIATLDSLHRLDGPPRFDIGGPECHGFLGGLIRVITGECERAMWQVAT